jgi:hypothetical protein
MNIPADKMGTSKDRIRFGTTHSLILRIGFLVAKNCGAAAAT